MFTNSRNEGDVTNRNENFGNGANECGDDEYDASNFYNFNSYSENDRTSDLGAFEQSHGQIFVNARNEHTSQSTPFRMKKCWNYKAVLNDGGYPRIKISAKTKMKKSKSKKSRNDSSLYRNDISSPHEHNSLKTRLKIGSGMKSSRKKSSKQRRKLSVSIINNSYNGLSSTNSFVSNDSNYENDLVPTQPNTDTELEVGLIRRENHYLGGREEAEYAPQYLELKPSVKFKCCRCGTNVFSTMALLQEHLAKCDGHPPAPVTPNSLLELSSSFDESRHSSVAQNLKIKRKVLLCSSCGTYYQYYNLYVHMRDTHNKEICLFCRSTFSKAQQLWDHLIVAHSLNAIAYSSAAQVRDTFKNFFITCCSCNTVFSDQDKFNEHKCNSYIERTQEDLLCTGCKPPNEPESDCIVNNTDELSRYVGDRNSVNSDDENERTDVVPDVNEEPVDAYDATLSVIGVSEQRAVTALARDMETSEVAKAWEVDVAENASHSESLTLERANEEVTSDDEKVIQPRMSDHQNVEIKSPLPSSSEDTNKGVNDDNISTATYIDQEPDHNLTVQQQGELFPEPVSSTNECSEGNPFIEPVIDENATATTSRLKEKGSNWLMSDEETENGIKAPPENEMASSEIEPVELPPQPLAMALMLDDTVASLSVQTLLKECVRTSCDSCLYCNNAILITVNGGQLAAHLRLEHRYMPTKPEDTPEQVVQKIEEAMTDLYDIFMNASLASTYTEFDGTFACLQCSFSTTVFKELCHHKRKVHHKVIFLCIMCKCNFLYYSQLLCHLCPGLYSPEVQNTLNYHCCFCNQDCIPSAFRLMVHLRKIHQACDICLTRHKDQSELFSHMIKQHKMNHLCYKCNLAYRSRDGINEHLFWKHGTESVLCKRCLQKKWPHAYHFCIPASTYTCEECSRIFTKAVALTVHRRAHNGDFPFACTYCEQRFISKKLLTMHNRDVHGVKPQPSETDIGTELAEEKVIDGQKAENSKNDENDKKSRKRKRKKEKNDIEKPLLDELPPLNLSSESEEDSAEEEVTKCSTTEPFVLPSAELTFEGDKTESTADEIKPTDSTSQDLPDSSMAFVIPPPNAEDEKTKLDDTESSRQIYDDAETSTENTRIVDSTIKSDVIDDSVRKGSTEGAVDSSETKQDTSDTPPSTAPVLIDELSREEDESVQPEQPPEVSIERIRNCLVIEHSYCIPDSIFHSEAPDTETSLEAIAQKLSSPKPCSKSRDRSGCKSVTPRKRKRPLKRESSSSDSSSDTDSSSSSCGSNCSCNQKSNSNCSSSSSGSEYSTTPDKKHSKNSTNETRADTTVTNEEDESKKEEDSLLNVRESDLDTDIETSDEEFYDKYPSLIPRAEEKIELPTLPVLTMPRLAQSVPKKELTSSRKNRKRRRAPKIKINLGSQNNEPSVNANISINLQRFDLPAQGVPVYKPSVLNDNRPGIHLCKTNSGSSYTLIPNNNLNDVCVNKGSIKAGGDASGRRSKRERIKNKFYGYSSSDDASGNESVRPPSVKKRPLPKRPPKVSVKQPFVGIRAKKPMIIPPKRPPHSVPSMSTTMAASHPSLPPHLYRMPNYIMQQQQQMLQKQQQHQGQYQASSSSSDDSDSGNLVINEPLLNDRSINNHPSFRFPTYPPVESASWQRGSVPQSAPGVSGPSSAPMKNDEKLYCYCRCPYDEVSEMIGCDGENCKIEWFHFECVGILVPPKGAWYCPQCKNREAVPQFM